MKSKNKNTDQNLPFSMYTMNGQFQNCDTPRCASEITEWFLCLESMIHNGKHIISPGRTKNSMEDNRSLGIAHYLLYIMVQFQFVATAVTTFRSWSLPHEDDNESDDNATTIASRRAGMPKSPRIINLATRQIRRLPDHVDQAQSPPKTWDAASCSRISIFGELPETQRCHDRVVRWPSPF